jgi:hypothetical protein
VQDPGIKTARHLLTLPLLVASACTPAVAQPVPLQGSSTTFEVHGRYAPVAIDRVERLSIDGGRLVVHGSSTRVAVDFPTEADPAKPSGHWALITEGSAGDARVLTFTHDQSLDDFTIELPPSQAQVRYGTFAGRQGDDVMVFAWGDHSRAYWGYVSIARRDPTRP